MIVALAASVVLITAAVGAHAQEFPTNAVPKVSKGSISTENINLQSNNYRVIAQFESAGRMQSVGVEIALADIIATCSNPAAVQAALVELRNKARIAGKAALKAQIEK